MSTPPPYAHQATTSEFIAAREAAMILNDPGTGKTRSVLDAFANLKRGHDALRLLVVAPLSILETGWADDIRKWQPDLTFGICKAGKGRARPILDNKDVCLINPDAAEWLLEHRDLLGDNFVLCIDEFTAFKSFKAKRTKAMRKLAQQFPVRWIMSGTPMPKSATDIWAPSQICDHGERLGRSFSRFRAQVCTPELLPGINVTVWKDKPNAHMLVMERLRDIAIRYRLEDVLDMPPQIQTRYSVTLNNKTRRQYTELAKESFLALESGEIDAVNAAVRWQKLLQLCSGAIYDASGNYHLLDTDRYKLVADLCDQRAHTLVAFLWAHQKDQIGAELTRRRLEWDYIDGSRTPEERADIVRRLQAGELRVVLAHPASAGHGLTMTRATTTIWPSPTPNAEWFLQFNRRTYRAGQTQRTEVIMVQAEDTVEPDVYDYNLDPKIERQNKALALLEITNDYIQEDIMRD